MKINKNLLASLGAGIEYYDFIIFGHLAGILSTHFFNEQPAVLALIYSYLVFSMAYLVRPLGGLIAGLWADKFGRQQTVIAVMLSMALATMLIGVLPTSQSIGVAAPLLLIICRLVQGLSFGAEMPSAITFITEQSNDKNKFLNNSLLCSSVTIGAILASLMMQLIANHTKELWRLPFLFGGSLAVIALILRKLTLKDCTIKLKDKPLLWPLKVIAKEHKLNLTLALLFFMFSAVLVIAYVYYATYFATYFNYQMQDVYKFSTFGLIVCAIALPIFAKIFKDKNPYLVCAIITLIFACYQVLIINSNVLTSGAYMLGIFLIIHQIFIAAFNSVAYTALAEIFPESIRATSVSLTYNLAFVCASFVPALVTSLIDLAAREILLWIMAISACLACFAAIFFYFNSLAFSHSHSR